VIREAMFLSSWRWVLVFRFFEVMSTINKEVWVTKELVFEREDLCLYGLIQLFEVVVEDADFLR
jgi:hypothetical protein